MSWLLELSDSHPEFFEPTIFFTFTKILVIEYWLTIYKKRLYIYTSTAIFLHDFHWVSLILVSFFRWGNWGMETLPCLRLVSYEAKMGESRLRLCQVQPAGAVSWWLTYCVCNPFLSGFPSGLFVFWHILPSSTSTSFAHVHVQDVFLVHVF